MKAKIQKLKNSKKTKAQKKELNSLLKELKTTDGPLVNQRKNLFKKIGIRTSVGYQTS